MDRKSIIILVLCFILLILWYPLVNKFYPPKPLPPGATNVPSATATASNRAAPAPAAPQAAEAPEPTRQPLVATNVPEQLLEVANSNARYIFTSYGGGLKEIDLLRYPESVPHRLEQRGRTSQVATLDAFTPAPTLAILDGPAVQGDGIYQLSRTANGVRAEKSLPNGLTIVKNFEVTNNYLVQASVELTNRSDQPLSLPTQEWVTGTATPMNPQDKGTTVGWMWYNGSKAQSTMGGSYFSDRGFACTPRVPPAQYRAGQDNVEWAAVQNQFFALAVMPKQPAKELVVHKVELPRPSPEEVAADSRIAREPVGYEQALVYPGLTLAPHEQVQHQFTIYAGPKEYRTLATLSARFHNNIDAVMGYGGFFGFFSKGLLLWMNWLHHWLPYGWAIVVITILIKLVFWPLTQASIRSAKRMQVLQPQIKALQEKYKDDPVKSQRKMMEFWKEHKVNPMSGCLPTVIQIPVFFGFYRMIQSAIELRGAHWLWVTDLSRPDTLFLIPGIHFPFNLLPLIMGATMFWQARLTPPSPGMDPTQAKLMRYMPLMFMVFLYNFSAGLTLYWTVNNLLGIVQTKLIRTMPEPPVTPAKGPVLTSPPKKRK